MTTQLQLINSIIIIIIIIIIKVLLNKPRKNIHRPHLSTRKRTPNCVVRKRNSAMYLKESSCWILLSSFNISDSLRTKV